MVGTQKLEDMCDVELLEKHRADGAERGAALIREKFGVLTVLAHAEQFIDSHSEPWYYSGQALLAEIRAAMKAMREISKA